MLAVRACSTPTASAKHTEQELHMLGLFFVFS